MTTSVEPQGAGTITLKYSDSNEGYETYKPCGRCGYSHLEVPSGRGECWWQKYQVKATPKDGYEFSHFEYVVNKYHEPIQGDIEDKDVEDALYPTSYTGNWSVSQNAYTFTSSITYENIDSDHVTRDFWLISHSPLVDFYRTERFDIYDVNMYTDRWTYKSIKAVFVYTGTKMILRSKKDNGFILRGRAAQAILRDE